ncbi:MAG: DHH family phosphoesterase [Thermoplasmata archaeon]|nr:MAG: DHH family phosphoesterase [Thermoplasmata archaeon]
MNIENYLRQAAEKLDSFPRDTTVRIVSHYDTDGICSAAILMKSAERKGFDFHVSLLNHPFEEEFEKLKKEDNDIIIFSDLGSGQIEQIREMGADSIILDHHQPENKNPVVDSIIQINSNLFGIDGNFEISGAGLSYLFAKTLDENNTDLSIFSLMGAIGDKQNIGGWKGKNKEIFEEARKKEIITVSKPSIKAGNDSIVDEIAYSVDPFYPGLSGRREEVEKLLKELSIPGDTRYGDLNKEERKDIHSFLVLALLKNNIEPEIMDEVIKERIITDHFPSNLDVLSDIIDSCSKGGNPSLSLAFCMNPQKYLETVKENSKRFREKILGELVKLEEEGLEEKKNLVYFVSGKASDGSYMSSVVSNYFNCKGKAVFSFTPKNGKVHVSCRATRKLVEKGLDLGNVMRETAKKFGGTGGGHKIAAGGTFEDVSVEELVDFIDSILWDENANQMQTHA